MLNSITLTNFRKHTDSTFAFNEGLTAIRGSNELGKTTITEGVAYALFGVKSIRTSLEDAVTYGQPVASLKVELVLTVDGVEYTVTRGKPGAEVNYAGGQVTGQTEVTNFLCRLLKVDAAGASRLMLAAQQEIRGALESGPKATTELIEKLAEFSQLDDLIELMQEKLTLGNGATAQAQVDAAQARLDRANSVDEPDFEAHQLVVDTALNESTLSEGALGSAQVYHSAAQGAYAALQAAKSERDNLLASKEAVMSTQARLTRAQTLLHDNPVNEVANVDEQVQNALQRKANLATAADTRRAFEAVSPLLGRTGINHYNGSADDWQKALADTQTGLDESRQRQGEYNLTVAKLKAELNSGNCTFCGKDFSDLPEIKAKNTELNGKLSEIYKNQTQRATLVTEQLDRIEALKSIMAEGRPTLAAAQKYAQYLDIDNTQYPPLLSWHGAEPVESDESTQTESIDNFVRNLRTKSREYADYQQQVRDNESSLKTAGAALVAVNLRLAEIGDPADLTQAAENLQLAVDDLNAARCNVQTTQAALVMARNAQAEAIRVWGWAVKEKQSSESAVSVAKAALKDLDFNNALLKKVRAARPVIADKLWNLVLAAVSSYFSEMRGFRSVVSKTSDGFMVDGHPVQTLSGSTLDILGLAIRVALVRTFLPSAPFLVLDEPCASMDAARTESLLGFLVAVGFKQVLVCSHDSMSEATADHVIYLEAP